MLHQSVSDQNLRTYVPVEIELNILQEKNKWNKNNIQYFYMFVLVFVINSYSFLKNNEILHISK